MILAIHTNGKLLETIEEDETLVFCFMLGQFYWGCLFIIPQGTCNYIITRDGCTNGYAERNSSFTFRVTAKFAHRTWATWTWGSRRVTWTTRVFVTIGHHVSIPVC